MDNIQAFLAVLSVFLLGASGVMLGVSSLVLLMGDAAYKEFREQGAVLLLLGLVVMMAAVGVAALFPM